uniref:Uncharacterized protein n=1 Tax=Timema tahoe TaxID=61484 RepID=A0A7R9FIS8_9NEOP|nr:unnamed protein product [Timema tahoe]
MVNKDLTNVMFVASVLKLNLNLELITLLMVSTDITNVIVSKRRALLKSIYWFIVNPHLTNVMYVACVSNKKAHYTLISLLMVNKDLTNVMSVAIVSK